MKIAAAHTGDIHLLLTDAIMPNMGGTELAAKLRLARPNIRILLSSGYAEERLAGEIDPFADASFLPKPFTLAGLLAKVRETLVTSASRLA
jgi:two-component system cell cycle sensor histidine kinase/response regulator CckA